MACRGGGGAMAYAGVLIRGGGGGGANESIGPLALETLGTPLWESESVWPGSES